MHLYPADLVEKLKETWARTKLYVQEEEIPPIPGDAILRRLLDVTYHASLLTEEGRQPRFRVVCCPRGEFDSGQRQRVRSADRISFATPVLFDERQLLCLAPATDPSSVMIAVEPAGLDQSTGDTALQIWGLIDTGSSWWSHTRRETDRLVHSPPDLLTISSMKAGQLTISRAWRILMTLENGVLAPVPVDVFVDGPIAADFEAPVAQLYSQVYGDFTSDDPYEPLLNRYNCSMKYATCIKRLLTYFMDKKHGGILLLLPDDVDRDAGLFELVGVKYACRHYDQWNALLTCMKLRRRWFEIGAAIARDQASCDKPKVLEMSRLRTEVEEYEHQLTDGLQLFAALSGVDGAVVLTDRFRLLGFGAELRSRQALDVIYKATDPTGHTCQALSPESYGTRHRSTFRFCLDHPRGTAFVHSQDGGMKAVKNIDGRVLFWEINPPSD